MNMHIRHLIIPLLVVFIVSFGLVQAGTDLCPPDCGHCSDVKVLASCCDDMVSTSGGAHVPGNTKNEQSVHGCEHGSLCSSVSEQRQTIAGSSAPNPAPVAGCPGVPAFSASDYTRTYSTLRVKYPPLVQLSPIYTLHCSFII